MSLSLPYYFCKTRLCLSFLITCSCSLQLYKKTFYFSPRTYIINLLTVSSCSLLSFTDISSSVNFRSTRRNVFDSSFSNVLLGFIHPHSHPRLLTVLPNFVMFLVWRSKGNVEKQPALVVIG